MSGVTVDAPTNDSQPLSNPRTVRGWYMYDWANSVYNLVITTTFFPIYFVAITKSSYGEKVPFLGRTFKGTSLYDYALAFAYLAIAILLPILSSIADSRGNKKIFMQFFCYLGGFACMGLYWFDGSPESPPSVEWGLICFILAAIGYIGSLVFYNSYLPEIAAKADQDRVSAKGYAMGYIGSVILQIVGFALVVFVDSKAGSLLTFLLVGIWWIGFAQITFFTLPKTRSTGVKFQTSAFTAGFRELRKVSREIDAQPVLKWYLLAFFFYSMGVQTVMLAATLFGADVLGLPDTNLIVTVVLIQLVAIGGAMVMSRLSHRFGNLKVLMGVIVFWIFICIAAYLVAHLKETTQQNVEYYFYALAIGVGLVMGGIQSLSRSTYSKLMPATEDTASYFSFYDVAEKIAIVIGIFAFGYIDELFGMKNSVLSLIVFFVIGLIGLRIARKKQKRALATGNA
ncbi:MFS transporter [Pseudochryseolinea flava]|uniref:MFS transporter n=1 Tax=Pseudochryseolinea flava TaxID=2059302 RepID=A0A364XZW6_9BACT|nr:MFS transporter [Pseudochryseolinea flava]RAV99176.1 MFS transporter [Pseudochryseolinea flava]